MCVIHAGTAKSIPSKLLHLYKQARQNFISQHHCMHSSATQDTVLIFTATVLSICPVLWMITKHHFHYLLSFYINTKLYCTVTEAQRC